MSYEKLQYEVSESIATITIDNPKANALSRQVISELDKAFRAAQKDSDVKAIILTGAGKMFVAGADITELNTLTPLEAVDYARSGQHLMLKIENLSKPVIAAVNGYALGGGCEIAMACTIRISSEFGVFGQPEVKLGLIPGFGGTQRLPKLVGMGNAMELLLTGDTIDATEAHRLGLVNKVVPAAELIDTAKKIAGKMMRVGPIAVKLTKDAAYRGVGMTATDGMKLEADLFGACFATEDQKEGTAAFLEKRRADFKGK
jgi:enoyl-CoA hydratase